MRLVERHIIGKYHPYFKECDDICFRSKNLYNYANYIVRNEFFNTSEEKKQGLRDKANYIGYNAVNRIMIDSKQFDYYSLACKVSNQTLMLLDKNWRSFFKNIKKYMIDKSKFKAKPEPPNFLNKEKGRFVTVFEKGSISKKRLKHDVILLSKTNIEISSKKENINMVRIVPRMDHYVIEVIYTIDDTPRMDDNGRYMSLDLGVNNLAAITSNCVEMKPLIISGKPLKSMNQYYNKMISKRMSILELRNKKKSSKGARRLTNKRNNKIEAYLHKSSKAIVALAKENKVNSLIIGKNDGWKQSVNMGKDCNQNFVDIPHSRFINMLVYKCEIEGINVIMQEESFTSKASFLDMDPMPIYGDEFVKPVFSGYRESRGMFKIKGRSFRLNSDVNGSYNILRKAIPNAFANGIEGVSVSPAIIKIVN